MKHYHFWKSFLETYGVLAIISGSICMCIALGILLWEMSPWVATGLGVFMSGLGALALSERLKK